MTELLPYKTTLLEADSVDFEQLATTVRQGALVCFPTDTVYGVACHPHSLVGIERLYEAKQRPTSKPLPLLLSDWEMISQVTNQPISPQLEQVLQQFWPGGLTIIVNKHPDLPAELSPNDGIAIRIPDHPVARDFIRACGGVLATSSANRSGEPSTTTAQDAFEALNGRVHIVINGGEVSVGIASTIIDCRTAPAKLVRVGAISPEQISILEDDSWQA